MSSKQIHISRSSHEVLFEGSLMKAPPLNRRGRKKWHERYFILKANRTLECYKSKKAANAQKSLRRVVDLRECINLEIGLEYKKFQHIMSLGTFKRTFFYAAPSDPLMLQWADVLEKAKNAKEDDYIEVLDIGLRRTKDIQAVHNVKPSSSQPTSPSHAAVVHRSPKRMRSKSGGNAMALIHFTHGSTETMDLRKTNSLRSSTSTASNISCCPSFTSEYSSASSQSSSAFTMSGLGSPPKSSHHGHRSLSSRSLHSSSGSGIGEQMLSGSFPVKIPSKVPPPSGILVQASRDKNGFFVNQKRKDYKAFQDGTPEVILSPSDDDRDRGRLRGKREEREREGSRERETGDRDREGSPTVNGKQFVEKENTLRRGPISRGQGFKPSPLAKTANKGDDCSSTKSTGSQPVPNQGTMFHSNLKHSFRYRKISLRKEFERPLYVHKENAENSDSDDEGDIENGGGYSSVPGPSESTFAVSTNLTKQVSSTSTNLTLIPADVEISMTDLTNPGPHINDDTVVVQRRANHAFNSSSNATSMGSSLTGYSSGNSYSKVTVTGPRRNSSSLTSKKPLLRVRSNSQPALDKNSLDDGDEEEENDGLSLVESRRLSGSMIILPPPMFTNDGDDAVDAQNQFSGREDMLDLPVCHPMGYDSPNSLDNILVDPPDMFSSTGSRGQEPPSTGGQESSSTGEQEPSSTREQESSSTGGQDLTSTGGQVTHEASKKSSKRKLSRTKKVNSLLNKKNYGKPPHVEVKSDSDSHTEVKSDSDSSTGGEKLVPKNKEEQSGSVPATARASNVGPDRDSTESGDTGYTSTSPGYSSEQAKQKSKLIMNFHQEEDEEEMARDVFSLKDSTKFDSVLPLTPIGSRVSVSSETSRCYVPLVFHSPKVEGTGVNHDPNQFSVQVCLVENSEELIKDLVSLKTLECFSIMEADEIHGVDNVAAAQVDDFTVETSLEDLEFGFSVIKSTQKDLFMSKVRQFTFEVQNLFGTSKPFSCDVEIRHADQLTILPIEVM